MFVFLYEPRLKHITLAIAAFVLLGAASLMPFQVKLLHVLALAPTVFGAMACLRHGTRATLWIAVPFALAPLVAGLLIGIAGSHLPLSVHHGAALVMFAGLCANALLFIRDRRG
jgi:predicted exporter